MQRGSRTLFTDIFETDTHADVINKRKGRNEVYHARRNELLINRYYHWGSQTPRPSYKWILGQLSFEFNLSETTIVELIADNHSILQLLKKHRPTQKELAKRWPHFVW